MENRSTPYIALGLLVLAHFLLLAAHFEPAYSSPDAHGYFYQAKLLAEEGRAWFEADSPLQAIGVHWLITDEQRFLSRYPPGFSLLLLPAYKLAGPVAALWVNPALSSLSLVLLFFLCRPWLGAWYGVAAASLLALNPLFNGHAWHADSHIPAMFFLLAGVVCLQLWASKGWLVAAFFSGLFLGFIPAVRYPEALVGIGVIAFLASYYLYEGRRTLIGMALCALGSSIPIIWLLVRNQLAFGAFWRTGYSLTDEQTGFGLFYFQSNAANYLGQLMSVGWGIMFVPALLGVIWLFYRKYTRHHGYLLAGAIVPLTLAYMAYYWAGGRDGSGGLRFFLPLLPLVIFAGAWFVNRIQKTMPTPPWLLMSALIALQLAIGLPESLEMLGRDELGAKRNAAVMRAIEEHVPAGSVLVIGRQMHQWVDYAGDWKLADEALLARLGAGRGMARFAPRDEDSVPGSPSPLQREKMEALVARFEGLSPQERMRMLQSDLAEWAGSGEVYWAGSERIIQRALRNADDSFRWQRVAQFELPAREISARNGRGPAGFAGGARIPQGLDQSDGSDGSADSQFLQRARRFQQGGRGFFGGADASLAIYRWNRMGAVSQE